MASASLTLYKNSTQTEVFSLRTTGAAGANYTVDDRSLAQPYGVSIQRKLTAPSAAGNDRIEVRVSRVEPNATTGKLATLSATLVISVPKDQTVLDRTAQQEILAIVGSLIDENTAHSATVANIDTLLDGGDL